MFGLIIIALVCSHVDAKSGEWQSAHPRFPAIYYNGTIDRNTVKEFQDMLAANPNTTMVGLNSDGGNVYSALAIAKEVDRMGLNTVVMENDRCYSACSFIFFAGDTRYAVGEIGVHQISGTKDSEVTQHVVADIYKNLMDFGVDQYILSAMFKTSSDEMYVFNNEELEKFHVNRSKKQAASSEPYNDGSTTFQTVASTKNGAWEALLLRNEKNGHYLCALETSFGGVLFRMVNYMTKSDAFVEVMDSQIPLVSGKQYIHFEFRKNNPSRY